MNGNHAVNELALREFHPFQASGKDAKIAAPGQPQSCTESSAAAEKNRPGGAR